MAKKYLKNSKGVVSAITTDNLQLEKPLLNENYDIEVHNRNMDKIDNSIQEVKVEIGVLQSHLGGQILRAKTILESLSSKVE